MKSNLYLHSYLQKKYNDLLKVSDLKNNIEDVIAYGKENEIHNTIKSLKDDKLVQSLMSICCIDYPQQNKRFDLTYNFLDITNNTRLILKFQLEEDHIAQSITDIFPNAQWYEREIWDLFGVIFSGNNDMRRILTDYGFVGHPMRKDFPLTGYIEMHYNSSRGVVVYNNVNLQQDIRQFETSSQWNNNMLPGDEKATSNK
jgi:NADH-quinone oxidoreductase subunit C